MASDRIRRQMRRLVQEWERSEESRAEFARRHGLRVSKLAYWTRRLRHEVAADPPAVMLAPVHVVAGPTATGAGSIEVTLPSGEQLVLHEGVSAELVRTVVSTLRSSC